MNKQRLLEQLREWQENGENEKIVAAILSLPEKILDSSIMSVLAKAYLDMGEYKKSIAVLEGLRAKEENTFEWQFKMGLALLETAENDDECSEDEVLRKNILERAQVCFARGMNLNPPEEALDEIDLLMDRLEEDLGVEYDDYDDSLELYEEEELDALEEHIKEYFGDFPSVFHEITSTDIHVDVCVVPPTKERNYYTLITMGMGAHEMDLPEGVDSDKARAELLICLPPDWKVGENDEEWFWPIGLLKSLAHLPIDCKTWLGWGHSVDNQHPLCDNTELCGSLLVLPEGVESGAEKCVLPNGNVINFFEVIPLYREEMNFKIDYDTIALLDKLQATAGHIVNINRPNCCADYNSNEEESQFDSARRHIRKIREKQLPLPLESSCNHIAIFMRWCIEHHLMAHEFYEQCGEVARGVLDGTKTDIRDFVLDYFDGRLELYEFSFVGASFLYEYYNREADSKFYYPADVDDYAESYFGTERYNSEEFQDEAYMFVPFDEQYYQGMSKYIQRAFDKFLPVFLRHQLDGDKEIITAMQGGLGTRVEPLYPDSDLFHDIRKNGIPKRKDGFCDVMAVIHDRKLCETAEDAKDILYRSITPFVNLLGLVTVYGRSPMDWVDEHFDKVGEYSDCEGLYSRVYAEFGQYPWLITFDDNPEDRISLFIRGKKGEMLHFLSKDDTEWY